VIADDKYGTGVINLERRIPSSLWIVTGILAVSELCYVALVKFNAVSSTDSVVKFIAVLSVLFFLYGAAYLVLRKYRGPRRNAITVIVVGAVLFRMTLLFAGLPHHQTWKEVSSAIQADVRGEAVTYDTFLLFDNDIWRYLWDGHVGARGVNPYHLAPRSPGLDTLADSAGDKTVWADIRANVNHADIPTIYPPLAQGVFRLAHAIAPGSVFIVKLLLVGFDLLTILLIALTLRTLNQPVTAIVLYAWNPLVIKAVAASGHVDSVLAMLLVATVYFLVRGSRSIAAVTWALSVLVKVSPLVLLPFLCLRLGWRRTALGIAVVLIGYAPYLDRKGTVFAGLRIFASEWQFNSGFFSLIEWLAVPFVPDPILAAKVTATVVFLTLIVWLICRDDMQDSTFALYSVTALGGLLILGPTVMPWYLVSLVPLAILARSSAWIQFSPLVCVAFFAMIDGTERPWLLCIEYGTFGVLLMRESSFGRLRGRANQDNLRFGVEGHKNKTENTFRRKACSASH
jgi:alpha-1,6-mannosyltransferase